MARAKQLKDEIQRLQNELDGLAPIENMSVRTLARLAGLSTSTAHRIKQGADNMETQHLRKALPYMRSCPLCRQDIAPAMHSLGDNQ